MEVVFLGDALGGSEMGLNISARKSSSMNRHRRSISGRASSRPANERTVSCASVPE
jgi:hypothetical protein